MRSATVIYPHQLFLEHPAVEPGRPVFLVEEPLILTHNPIHRSKLIFHFDTLKAYETKLKKQGFEITRLKIADYPTTNESLAKIKSTGVTTVHIVDTTDDYLERAITNSGLTRVWYESPLFILPRQEAIDRFIHSKKFMATFYRRLRRDTGILMNNDNKPQGGQWSFDVENRKRLPRNLIPPADFLIEPISTTEQALIARLPGEHYGAAGRWLPVTHEEAENFLQEFIHNRLANFGTYEDAISTRHARLWHSTLSPLLNIGLLTPQQVLKAVVIHAGKNEVPINSLEGLIRQILGWREFIRASYESDGRLMRQQNFFRHTRPLPPAFWQGTTGLFPLDHTITTTLRTGYSHHIERLMIAGSSLLLLGIHPTEAYRWFMGMYIDAYDWVMVPNVFGMSQFADGGSFATKPYTSGANYLRKMSDYPTGPWEDIWTALYWNFINTNRQILSTNHRTSLAVHLLDKLSPEKRQSHLTIAEKYLSEIF